MISARRLRESSIKKLHDNLFVVDMHNDVLLRVMSGYDISTFYEDRRSDIIKFKKGGVDLQAFSIFLECMIPREYAGSTIFSRTFGL